MGKYSDDRKWSDLIMQPIAIRDVYDQLWPSCKVIELDKSIPGSLATILDVAGADKAIKHPNGLVSFLAQRFRRHEYHKYDDFTLRFHRQSGKATEYEKLLSAIKDKTFAAGFYAYGLANPTNTGFTRFRVIDFESFIRAKVSTNVEQWRIKPNGDGTWFAFWRFSELKPFIVWELQASAKSKQLEMF